MTFDPSGVGIKGRLFGFPYEVNDADLVIVPVPWDVTVSYQDGTGLSPELILGESSQLDFSLLNIQKAYQYPVAMLPIAEELIARSQVNRSMATEIIGKLEGGEPANYKMLDKVNEACSQMVDSIRAVSKDLMTSGKIAGTLGGDHSTPLGLMQALAEKEKFGILQIDAHMDLREAYEGFYYSHASIMYNALQNDGITKLVQVGIRDFCEEELEFAKKSSGRVVTFFDESIQRERWSGKSWTAQVSEMVDHLPDKVYISFDMDGLEPSLCPFTGTPVPGGLSYNEAIGLLEGVIRSGRKIIGFDVSECGAATWDANVASRILYRLSTFTGISRGHLHFI